MSGKSIAKKVLVASIITHIGARIAVKVLQKKPTLTVVS